MITYRSEYGGVDDRKWAKEFFYNFLANHGLKLMELCECVGVNYTKQRDNINKGTLEPKVLREIKKRTGRDLSWLFENVADMTEEDV